MSRPAQKITRREFVSSTFTVLSLSPFSTGIFDVSPPDGAVDFLIAALAGTDHVRAIGEAHRQLHPEFDPTRGASDLQRRLAAVSEGRTLSQAVRELIEQDFRTGRAVWVEGWVLSATEAEICSLASQSHIA